MTDFKKAINEADSGAFLCPEAVFPVKILKIAQKSYFRLERDGRYLNHQGRPRVRPNR